MRRRERAPDFERMQEELARAQHEWRLGNWGKAESILRMLGYLAIAESEEVKP